MNGRYLVFEGPDGSGKTTQAARLAEACRALGWDVVLTREPGGSPAGDRIRAILIDAGLPIEPETEMFLFAANRAENIRKIVRPALAAGKLVISDRHVDSSIAYQGAGRGLGIQRVRDINKIAVDGVRPDLTILLDVPVEISVSRSRYVIKDAGVVDGEGDRFEREALTFHAELHRAFLLLAATESDRYLKIRATGSLDEVTAEIFRCLAARHPSMFGKLIDHIPVVTSPI